VLAKKIAANITNSKFSSHLVIGNILALLNEQNPCYSEFDYLGKGTSSLVLKAKKNNEQFIALKIIEFDQENKKAMEAV